MGHGAEGARPAPDEVARGVHALHLRPGVAVGVLEGPALVRLRLGARVLPGLAPAGLGEVAEALEFAAHDAGACAAPERSPVPFAAERAQHEHGSQQDQHGVDREPVSLGDVGDDVGPAEQHEAAAQEPAQLARQSREGHRGQAGHPQQQVGHPLDPAQRVAPGALPPGVRARVGQGPLADPEELQAQRAQAQERAGVLEDPPDPARQAVRGVLGLPELAVERQLGLDVGGVVLERQRVSGRVVVVADHDLDAEVRPQGGGLELDPVAPHPRAGTRRRQPRRRPTRCGSKDRAGSPRSTSGTRARQAAWPEGRG